MFYLAVSADPVGWGWWQMYQDGHPRSPPGCPTDFRLFSVFSHMADGCKRKHSNFIQINVQHWLPHSHCQPLPRWQTFRRKKFQSSCCNMLFRFKLPSWIMCTHCSFRPQSSSPPRMCRNTTFPTWGRLAVFFFSSTTSLISFCRVLRHLVWRITAVRL